ncbi:hypothetical protein RP29_06145 [Acidovorax temperans]|uniref:Uncharacterized protein n=1 Tax=Acidovorax temperans TaxID=80878 RepID=A0A0D7KDN8_9BURK|nr:hypothetical protein [Acidovorax temperans]KJA11303.1 hypothetical protein RP29_06145 [Acidovorax temperans]
MNTVSTEEKRPTGQIIWETMVGLANEERSITRQVLRDVTGLSFTIIDDHVERLVTRGKIVKAGKGLIQVVPLYPTERPQSLTVLPSGLVKFEIGDQYIELTPPEARRHALLFAGFARQFEEISGSNKALIRTGELSNWMGEIHQEVLAIKRDLGVS